MKLSMYYITTCKQLLGTGNIITLHNKLYIISHRHLHSSVCIDLDHCLVLFILYNQSYFILIYIKNLKKL